MDTTERLIEDLESAYNNAPNMFSIRIHHGGTFQRYPGRRYFDGHVDIFNMVDIDLFSVVALNMMVLQLGYTGESKPMYYNYLRLLTSQDEGLYALACQEDVRCVATLDRSFKLIEVYKEHDVTVVDSYRRPPPWVRATIEDITEPGSSATIELRYEKMLLLTWHDSIAPTKEPVCDSIAPRSLPQHDSNTPSKDSVCESVTPRCMPHCMLTSLIDEYVITYTHLSGVQRFDTQDHVLPKIQSQFSNINLSFVSQQPTASQVIEDVMWQLSFEETILDGEAGFGDVARSDIDSSGLSYDESFGGDDLDLNLNEHVGLNEPIVEEVIVEDYVSFKEDAKQGNGQENESAHSDGQLFYDVEGIYSAYETQYDVQSSVDACTDDDDDDFMLDKENKIVKPDVDVHLFGISMDVHFENIGVTNLVLDDVLEKEDVDVMNLDGFDSDPSNDNETSNYRRSSVRVRARCDGKVYVSIMSQGTGPTGPNRGMEDGPSGLSGPITKEGSLPLGLVYGKRQTHTKLGGEDLKDTHKCLQSRKIKYCTYKFLFEKIFDQVRVNPDIPVKVVQDQLQHDLEV
ncbi:hypothetical protein Tco_0972871 [Tanacetum coccineum]